MVKTSKLTTAIIHFIFISLCIVFTAPFVLLVAISLSKESDIAAYGYQFIPKNIDLSGYYYVFKNPTAILDAYKTTLISTVFGTVLSVFLMSLIAYPISRKNLKGRKFITFYIFFTMLFNGGLVPTYILISSYLNLNDTIWVYILPGLINAWHIILLRTFFSQLPEAIIESAFLDGASEFRIFFTMIIPLSKPVIATVALLGSLTRWNDWFTAMLYINDEKLITIQYMLQRIISNIELLRDNSDVASLMGLSMQDIPAESARMAMAIVAAGSMIAIFPFFQKYFVKGLTVGSVKG